MELSKLKNKYVWVGDYSSKHIPKDAGFRWDEKNQCWWTYELFKAVKLFEYAVDESLIDELLNYKKHSYWNYCKSFESDTELEFPCPDHLSYYPYQRAGIEYCLENENVLLADEMGLGKLAPLDSRLLTPLGWIEMGDIKLGDNVIGVDGNATKVVGVYPQGIKDIYKITFTDGSSTECGLEHLWKVLSIANGKRDGWRIKTTGEILDLGIKSVGGHNKWKIPLVKPVNFSEKDLPIAPYTLGVMIGDGGMTNRRCVLYVGNDDQDIIENVKDDGYSFSYIRTAPGCIRYTIDNNKHRIMSLVEGLKLHIKSGKKFIPEIYKWGSIRQRWELLRGLMDTDGSCIKNRTIYHTTSNRLADDIVYLVRSLGGVAIKHEYDRTYENKSVEYQVNVKMLECPFKCIRKSSEWSPAKRNKPIRSIESIEYVGKKEARCIAVESKDHLYVTDDFIVTHNTIQAIGVVNTLDSINKVLIVCPASLKNNWKRELEMWSTRDLSIAVLTSKDTSPVDANILIINYDILYKLPWLVKRNKASFRSVIKFDLVIADEAHYVKNNKAQRSKSFYAISKAAKRRIMLTGTPILNRPVELYYILKSLGFKMNLHEYSVRYCGAYEGRWGWDRSGATNLEELQVLLRSQGMIRRMKADVLHDLPPKIRQVIELDNSKYKEFVEAESDYLEDDIDMDHDSMNTFQKSIIQLKGRGIDHIAEMAKLRHQTALAKVPDIIEHVNNLLESVDKVIIFAHHRDVIDEIYGAFATRAVKLYGGMTNDDKTESVDRFQKDDDIRIFVGSISAAGVGLTLTRANVVVFAELDWVPANLTQAEDRAHRIGQKDSVLIQHIVVNGSIDANLAKKIINKQDVIDRALNANKLS